MNVTDVLKMEIRNRGISYSHISKKTGIPVDKLSKTFLKKRRLLADEFITICLATEIDVDKIRNLSNQTSA